jgi:hypothetical protein
MKSYLLVVTLGVFSASRGFVMHQIDDVDFVDESRVATPLTSLLLRIILILSASIINRLKGGSRYGFLSFRKG